MEKIELGFVDKPEGDSSGSTIPSKSGKPKIKGVSMTELFTPEQIREHIKSLRQWVGQRKAKAEKNQATAMTETSCRLCAIEKLTFEPPPLYCTHCGSRIKRNAMYYTIRGGETRHYFCIPCCNEARGDIIVVAGTSVSKGKMEKNKNDEETEEWLGNIKYEHYLMVEEMVVKQSILVQTVMWKKLKGENACHCQRVIFLERKICLEQF